MKNEKFCRISSHERQPGPGQPVKAGVAKTDSGKSDGSLFKRKIGFLGSHLARLGRIQSSGESEHSHRGCSAPGMLDVRLYRTSSSFAESCKNLTNNSLRLEQEASSWLAIALCLL